MDYKVLYRKYRPDSFNQILGQDYTISILKNAILNDKIAHAYIFNGPRGTGKTSTAKVFAKVINCENPENGEACGKCNSCLNIKNNPDIIEIDAASNNGVDEIRELINNIKIAPTYSKYKVYIIDEVHMMTQSAFNALLLTLEEPPKHVVFILATTNIESVPITILSRCQKFDFKKISNKVLEKQILNICEKEKIKITEEAVQEIAYLSEGGLRDALSILDQLSSTTNTIDLELIIHNFGSVPILIIDEIIEALDQNDFQRLRENIEKIMSGNVDYKVFIKKLINELSLKAFESELKNLNIEKIKQIIFDLLKIINNYNINIDPFILIELSFLENIKQSKILNEEKNIPLKTEKIISREIILEESEENKKDKTENKKLNFSFDKNIRINNCFANATKEYLNIAKEEIKKIIKDNQDNSFLISMLVDSTVVAASSNYYIFTSKIDSVVNLINMNYLKIEKELKNIKIVALTTKEWLNEKEKYIKNIKNGYQYTILEEKTKEEALKNENNSIENLANQLFPESKIEIE